MTGPDQPKLTLGQPPGQLKNKRSPVPKGWLWLLLLLQAVVIGCLIVLLTRPGGRAASAPGRPASAGAEQLRTAALELEERSLDAQAARAWQDYLDADPQTADRAEVLYRIGRLYMQADEFGEAAAALVRSELAAEGDRELAAKIGPRLVECLRRLGRYGEVGRELSRRVEAGADDTGKGNVLASLAGEELTDADLDRMIEARVDQMLAMQGAADEAARQAVLRQFSSPEARRQILQELLQTELFCRRARELKLDQEETFLQARQQMEQDLLASRFLSRQLERIRPTDVDLESYYTANRDRYKEPEAAEVRLITLGPEEDPAGLLAAITSADDFRKLAAERPSPGTSAGQSPPPRRLVRGRYDPLLGDVEAIFELSEGQWTKEPQKAGDQKHLALVEKKTPARTPPLAEVKGRVRADYMTVKQQELTEQLFRDLLTRYDVRIMPPGDEEQESTDEDEEKPETDERSSEPEPKSP